MAWFNAGLSNNSGGASSFNELDDVSIDTQTLSNGQVPIYNSTTQKWENGEQSGGSSGHTILDDGGTSLTQRDNLQFKGTYSEDDSTNEKTVVNVVREMTKAQFDLLSSDEKTGFINITDITGGNDNRFQPVIYSEEEREIGVWIDGKPLYEKTWYFQSSMVSIGRNWTSLNIDVSSLNVEEIVDHRAQSYYPQSVSIDVWNDNGTLKAQYWNNGFNIGSITIRYTKTTDTPGSGQWTPQGVPAHHYSEDEQIVGTWIDGSTIYEKTFVFSSTLSCASNNWTNTDISSSNIGRIISISCFTNSGTLFDFIGANRDSSNYVQLYNTRTVAVPVDIVTLRYTKLST